MSNGTKEGLKATRLMMVLSSISPLFILWAIRGNNLIPGRYFITACALLVLVPNLILWLRIRAAKAQGDKRLIVTGRAEDHRDHLLVYLITILLPFYSANLDTPREFGAAILAICFIVFLFWNMNLHYMNLAFAALGYRVFTVYPPSDGNPISGKRSFVVITKRAIIETTDRILAHRVSDSVFLESENETQL
jgi:hypothetical protein